MVNVIGVRFENAGKLYFFTPGALWPTPGDFVIVETTRGIEFGEVVTEVREIDDTKLTSPLKQVVRIATEEDILHDKENKAAEKEAFTICQKKIADHKLDMKLVSVEYTFDNKTILFYFTANGRVDFRSLVKDFGFFTLPVRCYFLWNLDFFNCVRNFDIAYLAKLIYKFEVSH